jgi:hypothetical protein
MKSDSINVKRLMQMLQRQQSELGQPVLLQ